MQKAGLEDILGVLEMSRQPSTDAEQVRTAPFNKTRKRILVTGCNEPLQELTVLKDRLSAFGICLSVQR
jgi:hypothetical protein